jgi:hypothetical protein
MSIHLHRFVDRVRGFETRGAKDFVMSMQDAKALHADITRLLIDLQNYRDAEAAKPVETVTTVQLNGGTF